MATKPEDINPFAQYVETKKEEPTSDINPFSKYLPYDVGTGIADILKGPLAGGVGAAGGIPIGIESAVRNIPRQAMEQQGIDIPEKIGPMTFAEELVKKGPSQLFTNLGRAFVKNATGESFEKQQERQKDNEIALDRTLSSIPRIPGTEEFSEWGQKKSEAIRNSRSEVGKARVADSQATGDLVKAFQNRSLERLSFGKDPSIIGYALQGSEVLGSMMPTIATAVLTKKAPSLQTKATAGAGFGMGAGEAVQDTQQFVSTLSDEQLAEVSPYFRQMVSKGIDPAEARKVVTDKSAEYAAQLQGAVSAFGDVITGKLATGQFDKLLTGSVKNRLGKIALGMTAGSAEEGTQEFLEGIAKNIGINKAIIKDIGEDSFANFILGAIGGGGPGAYRGAVAKTLENPQTKPPVEPPVGGVSPSPAIPYPNAGVPPSAAVPPSAPPASPTDASVNADPYATKPIPGATIEPDQLAPTVAVAPTAGVPIAPIPQTANLSPEVAKQIESLQQQYAKLEDSKNDPSATPFDKELYSELQDDIKQNIQSLISQPAVTPEVAPVEQPAVDDQLLEKLKEYGEPVVSKMDAKKRLSNGEQIYGFHEQDEKPKLLTNVEDLDAYTPDQMLALPSEEQVSVAPQAEEVVAPKFVTDDEGKKISYPMFVDMADKGYKVLGFDNPKTYENKGGMKYRTLEKDGVRIALEGQQVLFTDPEHPNRQPQLGMGNENDVAFHFIGVDPELRNQGKAKAALQDLIEVADKNNYTLYGEPAQLEKEGMTVQQLTNLYAKYGFKSQDDTGKVIVREPGAKVEEAPKAEEKPTKEQQAEINRQRQAEKKAKAAADARNKARESLTPEDIAFAGQVLMRGDGAQYTDAAKPTLKKLEEAGLIIQKKGKVFQSKESEEFGITHGDFFSPYAYSEDMRKVKEFLSPQKKSKAAEERPKTVVEIPGAEKAQTAKVTPNKIFTEEAAIKARNRLRSKLNQLNAGIDPELLIDGITLSGYHIEKGARTFAAYAKAMIEDLGDKVKPYLKQWYNAVRDDPSAESLVDSMDSYEDVKKASLPGATNDMKDLMDPEDKFDIAKLMAATMTGPNPTEYKSILEARAFISKLTGKKIEAGTPEAKAADETVEVGVVLAAQEIAKQNKTPKEIYDDLVDLYNRQPNLAVRTSTSIKEQAYSTPAPLAYVASKLADITPDTTVYEPTAGNGMLLIDANPKNVIANELNKDRFEMLKKVLPDAEVVNKNGIGFDPSLSDRIIANPPFGAIGEEVTIDQIWKTREIDHAIVYKALTRMPLNGKAVLIVGGVLGDGEEARREGYRSAQKRNFYFNIYKDYNVVDHFTVAGSMYKKQGASYPVDIIVIYGKGQSGRSLPAADLPKVISSYEQLKEKLNEPSVVSKGNVSTTRVDSGAVAEGRSERKGLDRGTVGQGVRPSPTGERPTEGGTTGVSGAGATPSGRGEPAGGLRGEGQPKSTNKPNVPASERPVPSEHKRIESRGATSAEGNKPGTVGGNSEVSRKPSEPGLVDRRGQEQETATQVAYPPHSKAAAVGTLAPNAMAAAIDESLTYLEDQVGDIDQYVADKLDFEVEDLKTKFSAEQVDALALAISNAEQGKGFIIGDQTGVGKGRVVAGMIKYALLQGQIPIFMTQKPNLYSDMIRDLDDIGMTDVLNLDSDTPNILITQADEKIPFALARKDKNGNPIEKKHELKNPVSPAKHKAFMQQLVKDNDLGKFKVIFSVYDSMNTYKGKPTERANMVEHFANNNYLILDESHAAGGSGGDPDAQTRAAFIRKLVNNSQSSFFSSATYAKRPDVMDLYSSTDMKLAVDNIADLGEAIKRGGVPMQQAVANMLTKSGQYIRRERTFAGVTYETKESKVDKPTAENMATAMRQILNFSDKKKSAVKDLKKELDEMGAIGSDRNAKAEVKQTNFGSTMHNLIDQMLLSLKTAESVDFAIERLKAGEKVVLTVANTMGSFMKDYADDNNLNAGDPINLTFSDLFHKYLEKQRMISIKYPNGKMEKRRLTDEELGPDLVALYKSVQDFISNAGFGAAPVSPIDYMHDRLRKAGYKTDEITGRKLIIDYSGEYPTLKGREADIAQRVNAVDGFNNGDTDVIILNQAGSTGLSLHASSKFKNQQKRHMIIVQPEKNIDTHMQMLGRVHRTGQIDTPSYSQMMADIPAEMRPAAVLLKKMASLNANTTASRKSSVTAEGVVDFMNDYGGQVVQEYLKDNPEILSTVKDKVTLKDDATEGTVEDIAAFTGVIPVFPIEQQEEIYRDITERYNELLDRENSMGTNKLEARAMDLDAVTLSSEEITEQKEGNSEFAKPAVMEKVKVKRTVKPYSSQEVKEMSEKNLDGKTPATYAGDQVQELGTRSRDIQEKKIEKVLEDGADAVRVDTIRNQIGMQTSKIRTILQTYRIGNQISLTDPNGAYVYGVIVNITTPKASANATAPSNWKMQVALANGDARSVTISFSQINDTYKLKEEPYDVNWYNPATQDVEYVRVMQIFDKGSAAREENRWMITGNLLAGFAKYPGQIVNYTRKDAEGNPLPDGQGILLPRQFDFEKAKEEAPVRIKRPDQVIDFLKNVQYSSVGTQDKVLRVVYRNGPFSFVVPKSKKVGGTFFLDEGLMKALGTQFTQRGSDMIANTWQEESALAAIDYIMNVRQDPIIALNPLKEARKMFAPPKVVENINVTPKQIETKRQEIRKEQIKRQAELSRGITKILKDVAKGNIGINMQRQLNQLIKDKEAIKTEIAKTKAPNVSAEWFRAKAAAENAAGNLTDEAYAIVDMLTKRFPKLLDGLRLSVRSTKGVASGNFNPFERLVTVFKSAYNQEKTMRHEISHALEQMMTPEAQIAVVENWAENLQNAIKKHADKPHQDYFQAVLDYIEKPTEANYKKATDLIPAYEMYQYISPSEYWAVNAEKLMKSSLGTPWARFVKGVQKIWESIKSVLGFNNKYAIHREFDRIMSGEQDRITYKMLVDYVTDNANALKFLNNIDEFNKKFKEDGFAHTPVKPSRTVKDRLLGGFRESRNIYARMVSNPMMSVSAMGGKLVRAVTWVRNKYIWFGAGLERMDMIMQKAEGLEGKLRDADGKAIASVAVTNAIRAGHIASEVILRGALAFNNQSQMFQAIRRPFSMANILMHKHDLIERVGLQTATDMANKFFEAKRSTSILQEYEARENELEYLEAQYADPKTDAEKQAALIDEILEAKKALKHISIAKKKVNLTQEQIDYYGNLDKEYGELGKMLKEWNQVNDNMIDMMLFGKIISKKRAEQLKGIKDYVPWYRIQDDMQDVHEPTKMAGGVTTLSNVAKLKLFKDNETDLDIDDIVDNMLHNVQMITRNTMRNYAANRVAQQYATRNSKGQIAVFSKEGVNPDTGAVRTNILVNGRRIVIEIKDPLVAEAVVGMENINMPAVKMLSAIANGLRRGVTLWPEFQAKQVFQDSFTAALVGTSSKPGDTKTMQFVTGLKDANKVWAGTFKGFIKALQENDPVVDLLKSYGMGGNQSYNRTPELEYKKKIGLLEGDKFDSFIEKLDHIGDASDYAQRIAIYNNVKARTGDEMLALMQANNVIDFLKHGSSRTAQFLTKTVAFMNAYAQQIDVLAMSIVGGRLTGMSRGAAIARLGQTAAMFGMYSMLYAWAVGGHDDYEELDDQTKLRNLVIPKALMQQIGINETFLMPIHTSASFLMKAIPEMTYMYVTKQGAENAVDGARLRKALSSAAVDSLLGPNPIPSGIKPGVEISLNRNFFTGGTVTPRGMEGLDAAEQYNAATSELGKILSALTGVPFGETIEDATGIKTSTMRVLNPIEADHLVRGMFGTTGAAIQWASNLFSDERPSGRTKDLPFIGSLFADEVGRGPEDLFYSFKDNVDGKYKTYMNYLENLEFDKADKYFDKYEKEISAHDYISSMDSSLREINGQIRNVGKAKTGATPEERRAEITELQRLKNEILDGVIEMRRDSGL